MNIMFGFGGRLARREYFLLTLVLAVVMTLLVFPLISALMPHYAAGGAAPHEPPSSMVLIIVAIVLPIFLWFSLALQAKRFRDIGWKPLYVLPGWIAAIAAGLERVSVPTR